MRKLLAISMILAMLLGTVVAFPVSATPTEVNFDDHLVTHWDFEGADDATRLSDKAIHGIVADDLTAGTDVEYVNGVAQVGRDINGYLFASGAEGTDLYSLKNKTIVMKLKVTQPLAEKKNMTALLYKKNATQISFYLNGLTQNDNVDNYDPLFRTWTVNATNEAEVVRFTNVSGDATTNYTGLDDMFHYAVISFDYNETTGEFTESYYYSRTDAPKTSADFIIMYTNTINVSDNETYSDKFVTSSSDFWLGKTKTGETNRGISFYYDDVKFYDIPMSIEDAMTTIKAPTYRGDQTTGIDGGKFDIRFAATMDTTANAAGFDISATYTGGAEPKVWAKDCESLYRTLTANNGLDTYVATTDFNSMAIMAVTVTGVDASIITEGGEIVFTVSPYAITNNKKVSLDTIYVTVTYADGEIVVDSTRTAPVAQ